ncbi:MAG: OsmC family protein [Dokdonella sp.]
MKKSGSAVWMGDLKTGQGSISTETGVLRDAPYGFKARFEDGPGTNPEELIGAAHAACFSMALSMMLGEKNLTAEKISTKADVMLEKLDDGFAITAVHLSLSARIPGTDDATFQSIAESAKKNCPVSKLLNAKITLDAALES